MLPWPAGKSLPAVVPYASMAKYDDVPASCAAWFWAGDQVFDVQAGGATADFCGCCAACDPAGHGSNYSTCSECPA